MCLVFFNFGNGYEHSSGHFASQWGLAIGLAKSFNLSCQLNIYSLVIKNLTKAASVAPENDSDPKGLLF